jgi:hypothetical protein
LIPFPFQVPPEGLHTKVTGLLFAQRLDGFEEEGVRTFDGVMVMTFCDVLLQPFLITV